jgi:hypothetical protein
VSEAFLFIQQRRQIVSGIFRGSKQRKENEKNRADQGCQMALFQTKNPNLGKFWKFLAKEHVGICNGHLVYFTTICYI